MIGMKVGTTNDAGMPLHDCDFRWRELSADGDHIVIARSEATKQSSFRVAVKEAGLLRFARNDVKTAALILATRCVRGFDLRCSLRKQRAQGRPGAGWHPLVRVQWVERNAHGFDRYSRDIPAFPAQCLAAYTCSPRGTAFLAPVAEPAQAGRIDARVAAPGPHDFAVRRGVFARLAEASLTPQASIATRATLRDDRETSLMAARAEPVVPQIRIPVKRNIFDRGA